MGRSTSTHSIIIIPRRAVFAEKQGTNPQSTGLNASALTISPVEMVEETLFKRVAKISNVW